MFVRLCKKMMILEMLLLSSVVSAQTPSVSTEKELTVFDHIQVELLDLGELDANMNEHLVGTQYRLSLEECVMLSLLNNKDIEIVEFEGGLANADLLGAKGIFDPTVSGQLVHTDSTNPPSPSQTATGISAPIIEVNLIDYQLQVGGLFDRWGMQYSLGYGVNREKGTFSPNSQYGGEAVATITQPLLRGRGTELNRVYIRTAQNGQKIAASEIRRVAFSTLSATVQAYWDLVGAIQNLEVRQQSLDNALRLVRINEQRLEIGTAAAIEVLQAKAQAATRQSDFIVARMNILAAEDVLKSYIHPEDTDQFLKRSIIPTTRPGSAGYEWNLERSIATALQHRPELTAAGLYVENATLEVGRTENDLLPQLDANLIYAQSARTLEHGDIPEGIRDKGGRRWTLGVSGSIPIGNRSAKGAHIRAQQVQRQQQRRLAKSRQDIEIEVRQAIRGVVTSEILIESNRQARMLQEANVVAEEKRLTLGVTTSQDVLDRQEDLTAAQTQELQATVDYEKALVQLQLAEGTLLDQLNIEWERLEERPIGTHLLTP